MNKLNISRIVTAIVFCWSIVSGYSAVVAGPTGNVNGPVAADPFSGLNAEALTPEKLQEFEAQLNSEIEDMVNNMKPEQKKIFDETVKRLEQKDPEELQRFVMGDMNDAEMEDFLKSVIPEEALAEEAEASQAQPEQPEAPKVEAKPQFSSKHEKAKHLIETIIKHTESFLAKAIEIPELENFVKQWKEKSAKCMPAVSKDRANNWTKFNADIKEMNQLFYKLLDKDTKKDSYKYLEDFINNENLYYNMTQLHDTLVAQEPKIETSVFGTKELSEACRLPVQNVINLFGEALDELTIPKSLHVIFDKYEPTAKKHREEEQKATDKALQASKQKSGSSPMRSVGQEPRNPYASSYGNSGYNGYSGSSWPSSSYTPSSSSYSPSSTPTPTNSSNLPATPGSASGAGKPNSAGAPSTEKDKDSAPRAVPEAGQDTNDKRSPSNTGQPLANAPVPNGPQDTYNPIEEIKDHVLNACEIAGTITKGTLTNSPIEATVLIDDLPAIVDELNKATDLITKVTRVNVPNSAKSALQREWKIHKSGPTKLKETIAQIKSEGIDTLDEAHREAFFFTSDKQAKPTTSNVTGKNLNIGQIKAIRSVSADDITHAITNLEKAINDFGNSAQTPMATPRRTR